MTIDTMPNLPITCLRTADLRDVNQAFVGKSRTTKHTVIDFWTTKCTNCPEALDKLDKLATKSEYKLKNVTFASINCDSETGARNIIEEFDTPRWLNVDHYHMETEFKERAKKELGFRQVPFLVVLNERGEIVQKGSPKQVDLTKLVVEETKGCDYDDEKPVVPPPPVSRVFEMDEDF
mmetsp:Transcript_28514/g.41954  ORF Transcript_28514/g.41954 Transcript_28514/m.41954 type:complete len:178 (-) Transcript_28514:184-717(-)